MKRISASRGSAITLTSVLREFKSNPTQKNLAKTMNHHGLSSRHSGAIMHCLKDMKCVSNHGRKGNKSHFPTSFRTSHVIERLHTQGVL